MNRQLYSTGLSDFFSKHVLGNEEVSEQIYLQPTP